MFFEGALQDGIAKALKEQKLVVCFVKDGDSRECAEWETEYLDDAEVSSRLASEAVVLRILSGSREAKFLADFCPLTAVPCLVVINNGQVCATLTAPLSKRDFRHRLSEALNQTTSSTHPQAQGGLPNTAQSASVGQESVVNTAHAPTAEDHLATMMDERRRRLEADKKGKETQEKAKQREKAEALRAQANTPAPGSKQALYAKEQKSQQDRQRAAQQERDRILRTIENDKKERKHRQDLQKQQRLRQEGHDAIDGDPMETGKQHESKPQRSKATPTTECALAVRLPTGAVIRSRFSAEQKLREVREWIDQEGMDGDAVPYSLSQVLAPRPNRIFGITDDDERLWELDLTPSATLILKPVARHAPAYKQKVGYPLRLLYAIYTLITGIFHILVDRLTSLRGTRPGAETRNGHEAHRPADEARSHGKVRTLGDQRDPRDDQQFYNGNQVSNVIRCDGQNVDILKLNFEPRKDDEDQNT